MPVHFFRVTPDPESDQYFRVEIFGSHERLQQHLKITNPANECLAMTVTEPDAPKGCLGWIYFSLDSLTGDVFSHEAVHAALAWWCCNHHKNVLNLSPKADGAYGSAEANDNEEAIAGAVQSIFYQLEKQTARMPKQRLAVAA